MIVWVLMLTAGLCAQVPATAADDESSREDLPKPLAIRQTLVRDRLLRIEDRMYRLRTELMSSEPEQALRVERAFRTARELLIQQHISEASELLNQNEIGQALELQKRIAADMHRVLKVLTEDGLRAEELAERIEQLESVLMEIDGLIEDQEEVLEKTGEASGESPSPADGTARQSLEELRQEQETLAHQAGELAEQMKGARSRNMPGNETTAAEENDSEPIGGDEAVQRAEQQMEQAADALGKGEPQQAEPGQEQALEEMRRARDEVRQQLDQARRDQQDQRLAELEEKLADMLSRQQALTTETASLGESLSGEYTRADRLAAAGLAERERDLGHDATDAADSLSRETDALVLPALLEAVSEDLNQLGLWMDGMQLTGPTHTLQVDVENTLREMIDALQHERENRADQEPSDPQESQQGQETSASSTELKMLRSMQMLVNRQTQRLSESSEAHAPRAAPAEFTLERLAERQRKIEALVRELNARLEKAGA